MIARLEIAYNFVDLAVNEGDRVRKGQFLLQIDPKSLSTRVDNQEASLQAAAASLDQLRQSVETARVQLELLKQTSVCITHAGLNTVLESLAQGVPQVAIPVTVDQPGVAARIAEKKTGLAVPLKELTGPRISPLLDQVLNEPAYRDNARYFQKVIAETNGLSRAADLVEESLGVTTNAVSTLRNH